MSCMEATKNSPLITIGVTCFNAEETIARAIRSAQKQEWPNFEIVVVDDASTDNSIKIIEGMQKEDGRIFLHRHRENLGVAAARNTIVEHAKGEYVAFFDDDDESLPERLGKQYERLSQFQREHPGVPVLCYCHRRFFQNGKNSILRGSGACPPEPYGEMVADFLLWDKKEKGHDLRGDLGTGVMMASRGLLQRFPFDPRFRRAEDWDIAVRAALEGGYFISVDEVLINQYATETDDKAEVVVLECLLMLLRKNKKYLQKKRMYFPAIAYMFARFYHFKKRTLRKYIFLMVACVLAPRKIMAVKIAKRIVGTY